MSKYEQIIEWVFKKNFTIGNVRVPFTRDQLVQAHDVLNFERTKNIGDIPYSFRFRRELPESIRDSAPEGTEWIIVGSGIGEYQFRLASPGKITPTLHYYPIKIPDSTPEIIRQYASGTDEQALLTRVRYNRLVDVFTGLTCYSLQNHLRTTVTDIGQVEVDELYVGLNTRGTHFILPCQAKSKGDKFGIAQIMQDIALCLERYPQAICRPIALQFVDEDSVAMLELAVREESDILKLNIVEEKQYALVPRSDLSHAEIKTLKEKESDY